MTCVFYGMGMLMLVLLFNIGSFSQASLSIE